jgi:hypothetical protein
MSDYNEKPVWRSVLSVCLFLFALIRIVVHCSNTDRRETYTSTPSTSQFRSTFPQSNSSLEHSIPNKSYNDIIYKPYKYLDTLNTLQKKILRLSKLKKDSLISLDLSTKIKIYKDSYLQNTHDDSLLFSVKTPKNLNIFIHDFQTEKLIDNSFKSLKAGSKISNYKNFITISSNSKFVSYSIKKNGQSFKGVALIMKNKEYNTFIEFESSTSSQKNLEKTALNYISENLKGDK